MADASRLETWLAASLRRKLLDAHLERASAEMTGQVLEIGNGHASRRGQFRPPTHGVTKWIYIDIDASRRPDVRGDVARLPLAAAACDTVVCLEVLEYVPEPAAAIREIHRVLRPNGVLVLSTPFVHRVDAPDDYWRFTEQGLRRLLEDGFTIARCHAQGSALTAAASVLKYAAMTNDSAARAVIATAAAPLIEALTRLDARGDAPPDQQRFTTGYLVVAIRRSA